MQFHAYGAVEHRPDAVNLHAYPGLTFAPQQYGAGIRFAHNGREIKDLADFLNCEIMWDSPISAIEGASKELGVSFGDVCDALKFLRDQKAI